MEERAVLDRVVDGQHAVLLVGNEQREIVFPADRLPLEAAPGTWLIIETEGDEVASIAVDATATETAKERIAGKLNRLRERGRR